jgi:hypothetical protein
LTSTRPLIEGTSRVVSGQRPLAAPADMGETGGGALIAAGLGGPIGPAAAAATLAVAARTAHAGKPYFAQEGGPELPVMDIAIAVALAATGFGRYSVDRALECRTRERFDSSSPAPQSRARRQSSRRPAACSASVTRHRRPRPSR